MKQRIHQLIADAIDSLREQHQIPADLEYPIVVDRTKDATHGDFACNIALICAKQIGKPPREFAQLIVNALPTSELVTKVDIAGPGFINFTLSQSAYHQVIKDALAQGNTYGCSDIGKGKRAYIEYLSANPTGPLHVGHGRSAAYGACVANLLTAVGFQVHREYYVNDAGRQMRILGLSVWLRYLQMHGESVTLPENAYQGDYIIDIAKALDQLYGKQFYHTAKTFAEAIPASADPENKETYLDTLINAAIQVLSTENFEIIRHESLHRILADIENDLTEFGVIYDEWFPESKLESMGLVKAGVKLLESHGHVYRQAGATWFRATDFGDEKDRVLIRENGQPTYFASDVAYHLYKFQQDCEQIIDIFGSDHHGYVARIKAFLQGLGEDPDRLRVLLVQFAILYRGKEKVSMSTRKGSFVTLRELREEVGNDAARYFYIMRKPEQHLDFDLELAKSQSNENPVYYIQYAHARIASVFRQMQKQGITWNQNSGLLHLDRLDSEHEKLLIRQLSRYPEVIESAALAYEPHQLAYYLLEFANNFHTYYNGCKFLSEDENLRDARLSVITATQYILASGLKYLGISAPDSM